jgi:hypothetical protein
MIEPLFTLMPNYPGTCISIIEDENFDCVDALAQHADSIEAILHVKSLSDKNYAKSLIVNKFNFEQKRYSSHTVQYDFVFLCADIDKRDDHLDIANKIYRVLRNAGYVFVLCEKKSTCELSETLENSNFVAINTISLDEKYDIISAKKLHGWMKV